MGGHTPISGRQRRAISTTPHSLLDHRSGPRLARPNSMDARSAAIAVRDPRCCRRSCEDVGGVGALSDVAEILPLNAGGLRYVRNFADMEFLKEGLSLLVVGLP